MVRERGLRLAPDTIHEVPVRRGENRLRRPRLRRRGTRRYSRPVPGDRVQVGVCKVARGLYRYTAIDGRSRRQVAGPFPRRTAGSTVAFLTRVRAAMPFPIRRIRTDRGQEFFARRVQDQLRAWRIEFRPARPRSPHLDGRVERVQRTALDEFRADADPADPAPTQQLAAWRRFHNAAGPHGGIGGHCPAERVAALLPKVPPVEAVHAAYGPRRGWTRPCRFRRDPGARRPG